MNNTLLKSEERSATTSSLDQNTPAGQRGVLLVLDVTKVPGGKAEAEAAVAAAEAAKAKAVEEEKGVAEAEAALEAAEAALAAVEATEAGTLTVSLEARDPASGKHVPLTAFAVTKKASELEAGTTLAYTIYPGAAETAALGSHEVMALALPGKWRVKVTHSAGGKWTYTVGASALR